MKMYEFVTDGGEVEHGYKPQYLINNQIFTCPRCSKTIQNKSYLKHYFWRKAVIDHMALHDETVEDEHA